MLKTILAVVLLCIQGIIAIYTTFDLKRGLATYADRVFVMILAWGLFGISCMIAIPALP